MGHLPRAAGHPGTSGQSTIDKVAGWIGEALIMTALGLAVAIPAVLGYNALVRGNKSILGRPQQLCPRPARLFGDGRAVSSGRRTMPRCCR